MQRVYNFSAGPSAIDETVLRKAQSELLCYRDTGMSVMEMSHRSKMYLEIYNEAISLFRELMALPEDYEVLFLQGGAMLQFSAVPLNLLKAGGRADYVDSGHFAHGAAEEAKRYGEVRVVASSRDDDYAYVPDVSGVAWDADYAYITTNNTIYGTRFTAIPDTGNVPLVADMSSNILSEPMDARKFGVIFAGAQKNIGPAGLCIVAVRKELLGSANPLCPKVMNWALQAKNGSMINTPNTYGIYMAKLVFEWLKELGGVEAIYRRNLEKAKLLYDCLDESKLYKPVARRENRSLMNVTFRTRDEEMDAALVAYAAKNGLVNLKGHRSVGGIRASIYNAMSVEGVRKLRDTLYAFEKENG